MQSWGDFESAAPEFATAARRLLIGPDGVAIGFLATASRGGTPHMAPVCPIFSGTNLYLSAASRTPKVRDLRANPRYSLHAFLGPNDEELQLLGSSYEVISETERDTVHKAIRFGSFDIEHPIFRLSIHAAVWVYWERVGQPDTRAVRKRWQSEASTINPGDEHGENTWS